MDSETIKTIFDLMGNPLVNNILMSTTISQLRLVGITASSRKDPARNMRLASNLARPFPVMVRKTPEILEIIRTEPNLFHKDPEHDQHNVVPASLLLVDKIAFGDLQLTASNWDYMESIDVRSVDKCRHLFGNVSLIKETRPMQAMIVRKDEPVIETKVPINNILKALVCRDYSIINTEEAHALSILQPWWPRFNHLSIEAISHKIKMLVDPPIKHIRANQQLPSGFLMYQPLVQFDNIKVVVPGLVMLGDDTQLIRACRYLIQTVMRETEVRTLRVENLKNIISMSQLSGEKLENKLRLTNNRNIYIQVCQMSINIPMQNEIQTSRFSLKITKSNTILSTVTYTTMENKKFTFEKYTGEEEIIFKHRWNPLIQGVFTRHANPPHDIILLEEFWELSPAEQAKIWTDIIMTFKTHSVILETIPLTPLRNLKELANRIMNQDLVLELAKFNVIKGTNLNYDYRKSLYVPELLSDLSVVNKGAKGGNSRISIYSISSLVESYDPKPLDLVISETRMSVYEIITQAWESLFYDSYTYQTTVKDILMLVSKDKTLVKNYSTMFKIHQRRVRNSLACNQQKEAFEWLENSVNNEKEKRLTFLLWMIVSSTMTGNGTDSMNSVRFGEYLIQPHLSNVHFYESETYFMILGKRYAKIVHNRESLKRKYDLTPTHQVKKGKILSVSTLINSDIPEGIVQVGNDIYHAKKRKYEETIDRWVTESIDSRLVKRPRLEEIDTDSEDDNGPGPSGECLNIHLSDNDDWFDSD